MNNVQKIIIIIGVVIILIGLTWPWISKLPFGKLPGDIVVDKPGFKLFFPITSMIILSLVVSLIIWIIKKIF
ncbi:MAG: DUF2905 domain-containing protein [Ignavibacterium sp.]|jgi:hypothetical protein|nr:MAG: DUF2905 domain-containing protein [Ignavibacterium sp.]MDD5607696.1 DUF2905 domain-containing protein [Ignavibacterium sp.]MDX9713761.1 DUF2905 domain-containing protein [Ignavibacteriaceae bacterium]GIK21141.1 MAG: hypothetical protein BroJett005_05550 [Ignavibacteriota bacterium]